MSISPSHTSNRKRLPLVLGAACSVGALLALSSPTASAVAPLSATANYDCGSWGSGVAKLTAADSGTSKTIKITSSDIKMPAGTSADPNSITTTLKLTKVSAASPVRSSSPRRPTPA